MELRAEDSRLKFAAKRQNIERQQRVQVIPTPSHVLGRISPIFAPFFPVFCAFSPSRRGGSNAPKTGTQGPTKKQCQGRPNSVLAVLANSGCSERMAGAPALPRDGGAGGEGCEAGRAGRRAAGARTPPLARRLHCVCDETVLDPLFATVSRPFRTVFRGLGAGFWNLGGEMEKVAKKRGKTGEKWARNGLKKVGPMTD